MVESSLDFPSGSSLCSVCNKPVVTATLVPSATQVTGVECQDCNSFFHLACHKVCLSKVFILPLDYNDTSEVVESSLDFPSGSSLCSVCNKPVVTATLVPSATQVTGVECQDCNSFFHLACHKVCLSLVL